MIYDTVIPMTYDMSLTVHFPDIFENKQLYIIRDQPSDTDHPRHLEI